jgi:hypothetical protein
MLKIVFQSRIIIVFNGFELSVWIKACNSTKEIVNETENSICIYIFIHI